MSPSILLVAYAALVCLVPLALLCLTLAGWNAVKPSRFVSGGWDSLALALGLSGFLAVGVPGMLGQLGGTWRAMAGRANVDVGWAMLLEAFGGRTLALGYFGLLLLLVVGTIFKRRKATEIYNVDTHGLPARLGRLWEERGLTYKAVDGGFLVQPVPGQPPARLTVRCQHNTCHATLVWERASPAQRNQLETAIASALAGCEPAQNPAAGYFLSAATALMVAMAFIVAGIAIALFVRPRPLAAATAPAALTAPVLQLRG